MRIKLSNLRQFVTHERAVLMACIGIALFFWVLNRLSNSFNKTTPIKLEYVVPFGKTLSFVPPQYAQVTWKGTGWDMLTGREQRISIQLNNDSSQNFSIKSLIAPHFGNDIIAVSPEQITVSIENAKTVSVRVEAVTQISFVKGFDLADSIELTPSVIAVEGPQSLIDRLISIQTDTLRFFKFKDSVITKIKLQAPPLFKLNTTEIVAKIRAEQFTEKSLFIPILVKNAPQNLRFFPNKIKLDCTVALSHYASLDADKFVAEVDLKHIDFKTKNNTVTIVLAQQPTWVRNIKFSPKSVEFYFEK